MGITMSEDNLHFSHLIQQVQHNCHLSDAHYAHDYSLCIYLLKMREFYRWEQGIGFDEPLPKAALGEWLTAREAHWERIEEGELVELALVDGTHDPFDSDSINQQLTSQGLIYSGGYCGAKPHFFLAELERIESSEGASIYISGREFARELTAPPAMSLGNAVFLRRESLRRMIWEKLEEWGWQDKQRAIARAASFYQLQHDLQAGLDAMTSAELDTLLQHELGELEVGRLLGAQWEEMLATLPRSRTEFQLRAVRDHLVDCSRTLPWLLDEGRKAELHFYFANFTGIRKAIFPMLERAYRSWLEDGKPYGIAETVRIGRDYWQQKAEELLAIHCQYGAEARGELEKGMDGILL
jgi:hypothetical protein